MTGIRQSAAKCNLPTPIEYLSKLATFLAQDKRSVTDIPFWC